MRKKKKVHNDTLKPEVTVNEKSSTLTSAD